MGEFGNISFSPKNLLKNFQIRRDSIRQYELIITSGEAGQLMSHYL
jgi:hypothetical protein